MKRGKKGVSEIIATVLIIFLTIMASMLVYQFVMPLIQNAMTESNQCNNAGLAILTACYDASKKANIEISRGEKESALSGIFASVSDGSKSQSAILRTGKSGGSLINPGEADTYVVDASQLDIPSQVSIAPAVKVGGKEIICKNYISANIGAC